MSIILLCYPKGPKTDQLMPCDPHDPGSAEGLHVGVPSRVGAGVLLYHYWRYTHNWCSAHPLPLLPSPSTFLIPPFPNCIPARGGGWGWGCKGCECEQPWLLRMAHSEEPGPAATTRVTVKQLPQYPWEAGVRQHGGSGHPNLAPSATASHQT